MSSKSFNRPDGVQTDTYYWVSSCGATPLELENTTTTSHDWGWKTSRDTPKYHRTVERGELLPLNAYERGDYTARRQPGHLSLTLACTGGNPPKGGTIIGGANANCAFVLRDGYGICVPDTDPEFHPDTNALLLAAMADALPDLDILTTLAESGRTIQMVTNARRDARSLISEALRGGKFTAKAAADAWLAWRYGWRQLGMDMQAVAKALKTPIRGVTSTGQSGVSQTRTYTIDLVTSSDYAIYNQTSSVELDSSVRGRVVCRWSAHTLDRLNVLADLPLTAWELVPYSFVADWFINIGQLLAAWKVMRSVDQIICSIGTLTTYKANGLKTATPKLGWSASLASTASETLVIRKRVPASIPSLVPSLTVKLTGPRIIDAVSLLAKRIL